MAKIDSPVQGFQFKIKTLYDVEQQLEKALPKMAAAATDPDLAAGFEEHLKETKEHSKRLEKIFKMIDAPAEKHPGEAIRGLIADGNEIAGTDAPAELRDAMLAGAGRAVENYEMACYEGAIEEAKALELSDAEDLLKDTLSEEENADKILESAVKDNLELTKELAVAA